MCDTHKSNKLGRDSVYKSLALVALAQQGKPLDDKVLSNYADKGKREREREKEREKERERKRGREGKINNRWLQCDSNVLPCCWT